MKINFKFLFLLFGLIAIVLSEKENKKPQVTKITITTTEDEVEEEEKEKEIIPPKNITNKTNENETKTEKAVVSPVQKRDNAKSEVEKMIQEARKNSKENTTEKVLTLIVPYQDNEDYILSPLGLGTPVNFIPLQVETTSYKTWVSSILNEDNPSIFSYNLKESKTGKESGEWDTVVDEEGTINGNVIYDTAYIGKYKIQKFKFIEAVEFEDEFRDYKNGKLGLGNCHYAEKKDKEFCLIDRLKENGSIDKKIFSFRELSDTHGELVIGDITGTSKDKDYSILNLLNEDMYSDIEEDKFKMGWLTKGSHILFRNNTDNII